MKSTYDRILLCLELAQGIVDLSKERSPLHPASSFKNIGDAREKAEFRIKRLQEFANDSSSQKCVLTRDILLDVHALEMHLFWVISKTPFIIEDGKITKVFRSFSRFQVLFGELALGAPLFTNP